MFDVLLLRFDTPLLSFGGPAVDNLGVIQRFPALSMITGLLANAMGYDHRDAARLDALQARLRVASRCDRPGSKITDFQTVDLGQDFLTEGWTTHHEPQGRDGGTNKGTHIRYRDYWADAVFTVAVRLDSPEAAPSIVDIEAALKQPERPLFLGRKSCLPAAPILLGRTRANSLLEALRGAPSLPGWRLDGRQRFDASWPIEEEEHADASMLVPTTDERDWLQQVHGGRRFVRVGTIALDERG